MMGLMTKMGFWMLNLKNKIEKTTIKEIIKVVYHCRQLI